MDAAFLPINNPWMKLAGALVYGSFVLFISLEILSGAYKKFHRPLRDLAFTLAGLMAQSIFAGLLIATSVGYTMMHFFPDDAGGLSHISYWLFFPPLFIFIEFLHYCIHRLAHEWRPLWKIHRTHHSAMDMSVGIVFRYNVFWALLLPQTWLGAFAVYMGQGAAVVTAIMITFVVNLTTHMNYRWDLAFRNRFPKTEPVWKVIERVITLPDTHHAHHGLGKDASVQGNYAITIFLFDTLLGTAKIPNKKQEKIGMANSERLDWKEELFWPVVRKAKAEPGKS